METAGNIIQQDLELAQKSSSGINGVYNSQTYFKDFVKNRFSEDTRYKEVCNILNSTNEMIIKLDAIPNYETLSEEKLLQEK